MRKVLLSILTITLLLTSASSFVLADDTYVPSIDVKNNIKLIDGGNEDERTPDSTTVENGPKNSKVTTTYDDGCRIELIVTPYVFRDTIASDESKSEINIAYTTMKNATSVIDMAPVLKGYGKKYGIEDHELIISNFFDVTLYHYGDNHDTTKNHQHVYFIKFTTEDLLNFVCLLHYDYDWDSETGEWEVVDTARIVGENKDIVTFTWDCASPFAIISKKREASYNHGKISDGSYTNVNTGVFESIQHKCLVDFNGHCYCLEVLVLLVVSIFLNVYLILKNKKYREDQKIKNEAQIK